MEDFYSKLVDLYAGRELSQELEAEMEATAAQSESLAYEMRTLRDTVDGLHAIRHEPAFTEESYQRVLMKLYARGAQIQPRSPEPAHLQYYLPIQG